MRLAMAIRTGRKTEDIYADLYRFPRWLYILIANLSWQKQKRGRRAEIRHSA
jgi:hypothetical protein